MLIINDARYLPWTPKDEEKEFHPMIKRHYKEIFGEQSIYFDAKHVMRTVSGIGSIPDAYVISLSRPYEWYVVENELASHPVYDHIVRQLSKFINGIENQNAKGQILDTLYDEVNKDNKLRIAIEKSAGSTDIYHFLSKLFSNAPRIVIIIDQRSPEVEEACRILKYQTDIVEFKTFAREDMRDAYAHLIEPLPSIGRSAREKTKDLRKTAGKPHENWAQKLESTNIELRAVLAELEERMLQLGKVRYMERTRKAYYRGKKRARACFAIFELTQEGLIARIRADRITFKDPQNWSIGGIRKGMFFDPQSKFRITNKDQVSYAMSLIEQAFEISENLE